MSQDLLNFSAAKIRKLLKRQAVSPLELLDALEQRISLVDGKVNALPILCFERARTHAKALMKLPQDKRGLLQGLPLPIKDLTEVAGVRTTYGSPIFADFIPQASDFLVQNLEKKGGIVYAKSNVPEFGAGGNMRYLAARLIRGILNSQVQALQGVRRLRLKQAWRG
jgi:amidase